VNRVLIVDDDSAIRDALRSVLSERYEVFTAGDGEEGLAVIDRRSVDLIVLDMLMPLLDGEGMLRALRSRGISLPVIAVSADWFDRAGDLKANAYLSKPFEIEELEETIDELLGGRTGSGPFRRGEGGSESGPSLSPSRGPGARL
jgi:DNA-binding response OmpR family regulator